MASLRLLVGVLAVVLGAPSVHALDVTPVDPVAKQPVRLTWPQGADPTVEVTPLVGDAIAATWGGDAEPHVHGLRLGGNVLHLPFADVEPEVRAFVTDGDAAGEPAFVGAAVRHEAGWAVPITFQVAGNWTLTVNGDLLEPLVVPPDGAVATTDVPTAVLVALEGPLVLHPPAAGVTVHVASPAHGGGWEPHRGGVTIALGNATVDARPTTPGRYHATLPVQALPGAVLVWVNVSTPKGTAEAVLALPRATVPLPDGGATVTFQRPGAYLVTAHDWTRGLHDAERIEVAPTLVHVTPTLPATLVGVHDASFRLTWPSGHAVRGAADVNLTRERPGGAVEDTYPVQVDADGTVRASVRFPAAGDHVLRLVVPSLGVDESWSLGVAAAADDGVDSGGDPPRDTPLPLLWAVAAIALAAGGRRPWT